MLPVGNNPSAIAQELTRLLGKGQGIPGLENLDPSKLIQVRDGLKGFLDQFDQAARGMPELSQLAGSETLKGIRDLAKLVSCQVDAHAVNNGQASALGAGGGGGAPGAAGFNPLALNEAAMMFFGGLLAGGMAGAGPLQGLMQGLAAPPGGAAAGQAPAAGAPAAGAAQGGAPAAGAAPAGNAGADPQLDSLKGLGGGGAFFEDRVFAVMCKIVEDMQKKIEERLKKLQEQAEAAEKGGGKGGKGGGLGGVVGGIVGAAAPIVGGALGGPLGAAAGKAVGGLAGGGGGGGGAGGAGGGQESRNIEFEKIKNDMQKLSQMQQAMSNVLNTMDELAKNAIRHIKV